MPILEFGEGESNQAAARASPDLCTPMYILLMLPVLCNTKLFSATYLWVLITLTPRS